MEDKRAKMRFAGKNENKTLNKNVIFST